MRFAAAERNAVRGSLSSSCGPLPVTFAADRFRLAVSSFLELQDSGEFIENSAGMLEQRKRLLGLVDLVRFELTTSSMPWKRAPNCATGPREVTLNITHAIRSAAR